ncbi:MAG: DNA polymerase ligase N-terminal domain-containing protein [Planctomycetota bacterium]
MAKDPLAEYHRKRDFDQTPEPRGAAGATRGDEPPRFVVQKHAARRLHYDVRLEIDGVLVSWAVPKGPSLDPADKRLAVRTEDHPIEYAGFEGVIGAGYGAGTVQVWDTGVFQPLDPDTDLGTALRTGRVEVALAGSKLQGGFVFIHSKMRGDEKNWLLIKMKDAYAAPGSAIVEDAPDSAISGRSLEQIAQAEG